MFASEHLNNNTPVHVIQALLGHATLDTVMVYAKLYPDQLVEEYRKAMRGALHRLPRRRRLRTPTADEWAAFAASCSTCATWAPTCARCRPASTAQGAGLPRLQPRPTQEERRPDLPAHARQPYQRLDKAREDGEPAGQIAARELEIDRIRAALRRAEELTDDVAAAIEAAADGSTGEMQRTAQERTQAARRNSGRSSGWSWPLPPTPMPPSRQSALPGCLDA